MPKKRNSDKFKSAKVTRVRPESEQPKHHHHHEHNTMKSSIPQAASYVEEYELESVSPVDDRSSVSSIFSVRPESPPIEIIKLSPAVNNPSHLTIHQPDASSSILTTKPISLAPSSFRSYVVSPDSGLLRRVSLIPSKLVSVVDEGTLKRAFTKKKQLPTLPVKPVSVPFMSLALAIGLAMCTIIVLALILSAKRKEQSVTSNSFASSACAANCMMSLTPFLASTIASWPFDGSLSDLNNVYSASYTDPPNIVYNTGNMGDAVSLSGSQYVYASTQFMNLSYRSWTIEAWLLLTDLSSERGIFGQCESPSTTDKCLSLSIKSQRLHLSFNNDDLDGVTITSTSSTIWRHVAFVYDYTSMQQSIYLDGVLEATTGASGIAVGPYKGTTGPVTIGWITGNHSFIGRIDHLQVSSGAKTACQILNDATLTAYYAFDVGASYLDSSMNVFHGIANLLITVPGRVNYAYSFQYEYSYFQSMAFTAYFPSETFSVALWVKPFVVNGGTLIRISTGISGYSHSCFDLLGFSSAGQLIAQLFSYYDCCSCCDANPFTICVCQGTANIGGPTMVVNTWTHIVLTYSSTNGLALYTNGTLQGVNYPLNSFPSNTPDYKVRPYMTVGNPRTSGAVLGCIGGSPSLSSATYQGLIDELRIYSRELTKTEICALFHV